MKSDIEKTMDEVRRRLAAAKSAQEITDAGSALPEIIPEIEARLEALDDAIAAEAESIDRKKTNELRAEKGLAADLLTDAEYLARRVDERHRTALAAENEKNLLGARDKALAITAEIHALTLRAAPAMQELVAAANKYGALKKQFAQLITQLNTANRADLKPPHYWRGLSEGSGRRMENFEIMFDFMSMDGMTPEVVASSLLTAAARITTNSR